MKPKIKIGDLVESCSLMVGVVMGIDEDDLNIRRIDLDYEYDKEGEYSSCSLSHCGVIKLTPHEARMRITLGKEKLEELWKGSLPSEYPKLIETEYNKLFVK